MKYEPLPVELLISRGECCGSSCQNCPYTNEQGVRHIKGSRHLMKQVLEQLLTDR